MKARRKRPVILLILVNLLGETSGVDVDATALADLVSDLSSLGNTELNVISDFSSDAEAKIQVMSKLQVEGQVPVYAYDLHWLREHQVHLPQEPCPVFGTGDAEQEEGEGEADGREQAQNQMEIHQNVSLKVKT